jgi:hypothetical protein
VIQPDKKLHKIKFERPIMPTARASQVTTAIIKKAEKKSRNVCLTREIKRETREERERRQRRKGR